MVAAAKVTNTLSIVLEDSLVSLLLIIKILVKIKNIRKDVKPNNNESIKALV